jgi:GT2 family glycosyltransferase
MSRRPILLSTEPVHAQARNGWAQIKLDLAGEESSAILFATLHDGAGHSLSGNLYLHEATKSGSAGGRRQKLVCFIPGAATELRLHAVGHAASALGKPRLSVRRLTRALASAKLLLKAPRGTLSGLLRHASLRPGLLRRQIRQMLATTAYEARIPRQDYATWITLFDQWDGETFPSSTAQPSIAYLVLAGDPSSEALAATLRSLATQRGGAAHRVADPASDRVFAEAMEGLDTDYVGILSAGEVLPSHATLLAADQLHRLGEPDLAIADDDEISPGGERHSPHFKPMPNHALMLSGTLARGLWLVRRSTFLRYAAAGAGSAEELRTLLWLARYEAKPDPFSQRIPFVLSHRRPDTETASPEGLSRLVEQHLAKGGPAITPDPTWPITFNLRDRRAEERITVVIPSTLRQPHSLSCVRAVLEGTDHPGLDLHVVVMQPSELDARQRGAAEELRRYPNAHVTWLEAARFNFSAANNHIAARTSSDHILLLNDDVSPIRADWLRWMAAFLRDPQVGAAGARLLYPDGRVQHGGVIMGLAGLCDHAHRYLPGSDPGYMHRAVLAQQLSAVTAACMLVRRSLYEQVGGLDESYPSAFNDVDFALRIGETGHSIVYVPQAELHHHELQTYGSHYAGDRQPFQEEEIRRMRRRWSEVCAADPFHNPNLGLTNGFEWRLAFPPRVGAEYG